MSWSSCVSGVQTRDCSRACNNPYPSCGGSSCSGSASWTETNPCAALTNPYWATLTQPNIAVENTGFGDTILMRMPGTGLEASNLVYTVGVKNGTTWWNPLSWLGIVRSWNSMPSFSGTAEEVIEITNNANHKFDVSIQGISGSTKESSELNVLSVNNSLPVAVITSPTSSNVEANVNVPFTHASYDEDDLLQVTWDFGDGTNYTVYNYSKELTASLGNTNHIYANSGAYKTTLTVKEMKRNQQATQSIQIFAFKPGINVFPIITSPENAQVYTNWVKFNASQSFIANCSTSMTGSTFSAGSLKCLYIHAPGSKTLGNYNLSLTWNVKEQDGSNSVGFPISGKWAENYTGVVEFSRYFGTAAKRSATLVLDYN